MRRLFVVSSIGNCKLKIGKLNGKWPSPMGRPEGKREREK
jgi:hypothetical protein